MGEQKTTASSVNRAKTYQLVLFPLNNGATNVYYVLVLSYIATFGSKVLALSMLFASVMVTGMRLFDAVTDPIIGALMDRTNGRFGKFRPFMVIGNLIMAASILVLYCLTPLIPASAMGLRYAAFVALYAVWVIGYTFQTSCTRSGQTVLTNATQYFPFVSLLACGIRYIRSLTAFFRLNPVTLMARFAVLPNAKENLVAARTTYNTSGMPW